jgi:hypothetical protein
MIVRNVEKHGCKISVDLTPQVLRLEVPEDEEWTRTGGTGKSMKPVTPSATLAPSRSDFVSAATLLLKAKQFDDGLYAAVELACQRGCTGFEGKKFLLQQLCAAAGAATGNEKQDKVSAVLHAATRLGGGSSQVPAELQPLCNQFLEDVLADEKLAKPISFYTWSSELQQIWQQDRALQLPLVGAGVGALLAALRNDPALKRIYITYVDLIAKLTNPFVKPSLTAFIVGSEPPQADEGYSLFPSSTSPEYQLMRKLFGDDPPPPNFSLIDRIIAALKSGELSLKPTVDSGWYDYALWAIEPLVIPHTVLEAKKIQFGDRYQKALLELFKGAYALTRETHCKQLASPGWGSLPPMEVTVSPELTVEPLPTVYLRRAIGYKFIREVLEHSLGERALHEISRETANGPLTKSLAQELVWIENFFFGAHLASCAELGMEPGSLDSRAPAEAIDTFRKWKMEWDSDVGQDVRMMVPIYYDPDIRKLKCWIFLGWTHITVNASYVNRPAVLTMDTSKHPYLNSPMFQGQTPMVSFDSKNFEASYPITVEAYVDRLMNRNEFRSHCDKYGTAEAILQALNSGT